MSGKVLVTGGAGYIGTHVMATLGRLGYQCVCLDNFANARPEAVERAKALAPGAIESVEADIRDAAALRRVLADPAITCVVHLAGLKAVGESVADPERYFDNNVRGTQVLLAALSGTKIRSFVFSSSAAVYGDASQPPLTEASPTGPQSPYGENKLAIERLLAQLARDDRTWRVASLRYFNPVGAHESGTLGEDPAGVPSNLMPLLCQVAAGRRDHLKIFGDDYATPDGTCIRDFIHVMDLAEGHAAALRALGQAAPGTAVTVNLGTGRGHSVIEMVEAFERVNGVAIPREIAGRRPGDVPACYADCSLARRALGWSSRRGLDDMCRDAWRWQCRNPAGYAGSGEAARAAALAS